MWDFVNNNYENLIIVAFSLLIFIILFNLMHFAYFIFNLIFKKFIKKRLLSQENPFLDKSKNGLSRFNIECPIIKSQILQKLAKFFVKLRNIFIRVVKFLFKWHFYYINVFALILLAITVYFILIPEPKVISSSPKSGERWINYEDGIEVVFNRPVNVDDITINIAPEIKGHWEEVKLFGRFNLITKLKFIPEETVMPDEEMLLYIVGFNPKDIGEDMIEFKSAPIPNIISSNVSNGEINVPVDSISIFNLDLPTSRAISWSAEINPSLEFDLKSENNAIRIIPKTRLELNTEYEINIFRQKLSYNIKTQEVLNKSEKELAYNLKFKTDSVALINSVEPSGTGVRPDSVIRIVFNKKIDPSQIEKLFEITPQVQGDINWIDEKTLEFRLKESLSKGMKYSIILKSGIRYDNVQTLRDYIFDFETIGKVRVLNISPSNGSINIYPSSKIKVTFDQEVDKLSAQQHFSITPNVPGNFSWDGNTMIFTPSASFGYETNYTVKISKGIKSIYGLDSVQDYSSVFKTRSESFIISSVPYYRQVRRFECELLATRMVLAYRGVYLGTDQIMYEIGIDPTPYDSVNNIWGDPNVYYVGNVNGNPKGYGVHLDPLAKVARNHGRSATVVHGWTASKVAYEVQKGNPVIILAQNNYSAPTDISWHTIQGKYIHAINGTHAYIVVGFKGSPDNPTSMLLQDPWYRGGSRRWHSISLFNRLWGYHGNSALIIY